MIKKYDQMLSIVTKKNQDQSIVDARPPNLFNGKFFFLLNFITMIFLSIRY